MKKSLIILFVVLGVAILIGIINTSLAKMPDEQCQNFAINKDEIVQKQVVYNDIKMTNYYITDPCTMEVYDCRASNPMPICEEIDLLYSYDGYPTHHQRTYFSATGSIWGKIVQYGWRGGQSFDYIICSDGTAKVAHAGVGWYGGNIQETCNSMN